MIEHPIIAKRLGDAARAEIENKYSSKIMSQNYEKIFHEISSK
jgi:glycosyltransferase involved in cell wall biosynthesis